MNIPINLRKKLDDDPIMLGLVNTIIPTFEPIINSSRYTFFEEYTDHGIKHLETILNTAEWLMGDTIKNLNSKDIAVLILSVFLHDLGMHISYDGLVNLIHGKLKDNKSDYFREKNWEEEWKVFFREAKKWNEKKLKSVFGKIVTIKEPPRDEDESNGIDKKLYGEFLRRNHPRLAHEIAVFGFPGRNGELISFANDRESELIDLCGLIARSHGIDVRSTFDYLKNKYMNGWRTPYDVKVIYLMIVIRIADYLHITSERAGKIILKQRRLSSPYSELEFNLHNSVKFINRDDDDPETLYVQANPNSSFIYLRLVNLLRSIQNELDSSWAVLGEVYGRFPDHRELGIIIRRIKSNIDNIEWLYDNVDYIPSRIHFDSDPELLKLLVAPLYGDDPSYGVRELIQNSVDSCFERECLILQENTKEAYIPKVEIFIENRNKEWYFIIKDNGIGMDENILTNYFFKAGASFRKSETWVEKFAKDDGKSKVQRSGRFGVGVLSAFLLGSEITVTTRNIDSKEGYKFTANIDDEQIEIKKIDRDYGTTIEIIINERTYNTLKEQTEYSDDSSWDKWYKFKNPELTLSYPSSWVSRDKNILISPEDDGWKEIHSDDFNGIFYTYDRSYAISGYLREKTGELVCNGIYVPNGYKVSSYPYPEFAKLPYLSVIDYDGKLPLSLDRNSLSDKLPFERSLLKEICKDIIYKLLGKPDVIKLSKSEEDFEFNLLHPAIRNGYYRNSWVYKWGEGELLYLKNGYSLPHTYCIERLGIKKIIKIWSKNNDNGSVELTDFVSSDNESITISYIDSHLLSYQKERFYDGSINFNNNTYNVKGKRIFIPTSDYKYFMDKPRRLRKDFRESVKIQEQNKMWTCLNQGVVTQSRINIDILEKYCKKISMIIEYDIEKTLYESDEKEHDIMDNVLEEILGEDVLIPYDTEFRKEKFSSIFNEMNIIIENSDNKQLEEN